MAPVDGVLAAYTGEGEGTGAGTAEGAADDALESVATLLSA